MEFAKPEIIAVLGVLSAVIVAFWRLHLSQTKREEERLKRCEALHSEASNEVKTLTGELKYLEGRMSGVEALSKSVLQKIEENNNDSKSV